MAKLRHSILMLGLLAIAGCGGGKSSISIPAGSPATGTDPPGAAVPAATQGIWPASLPKDGVQPWEQTDAAGIVKPASRATSSINGQSIFAAGVESFTTGGTVTAVGEASHIAAGTVGSKQLGFATYRLTLGGVQPGVVGLDVNLGAAGSAYYVGLSDYATGQWQWRGPFSDNHIRLAKAAGQLDSANYLSPVGNLFVAVAAFDGSSLDVVGVGTNPVTDGDAALPPSPSAFSATPEEGGLLLEWTPSAAGDLAGYRVLWANTSFSSASAPSVNTYSYADGGGRLFLPLPQRLTYVAIQAVDIAGNASPLTNLVNAVPLAGAPPALTVSTSAPSGLHDTAITLTASGARSYDFDLDGDGVYDVTGDTTGTAQIDTSKPGIIRPSVRGHGNDGTAVALGGVSLIITGNTRPAIRASANPQSGVAPLQVDFTAIASDAEDPTSALSFAWDFDGDGIFDATGPNLANVQHSYTSAGLFNAKAMVGDPEGAWAVDTLTIQVSVPNTAPVAAFTATAQQQILPMRLSYNFDGSASSDPEDGPAVHHDWDFNGDGVWDAFDAPATLSYKFNGVGTYASTLRVRDAQGWTGTATRPTYVPSLWNSLHGQPGTNTRQSPIVGTQTNNVKWSYTTGGAVYAGAVVGADGTIYVSSFDHKVYALRDNGTATPTVKWTYTTTNYMVSTPAVGADGTVYVGDADGKVLALVDNGTPTATLKWSYATTSTIFASPAIGPDGTVYIASEDHSIYALADNGSATPTVKWKYATGSPVDSSPILGPDGTVYVGSADNKVYALRDNGTTTPTVKWSYVTGGGILAGPALGPDGTVYVGSFDHKLYALSDNGTATPTLKWSFTTGDSIISIPAIGDNGVVYIGSQDGVLYALVDNGSATPTVKWSYATGDLFYYSSPLVGADNTVYVGCLNKTLYAFMDNGTSTPSVKWSYVMGNAVYASPSIGPDGRIYCGSNNGKLLAFGP